MDKASIKKASFIRTELDLYHMLIEEFKTKLISKIKFISDDKNLIICTSNRKYEDEYGDGDVTFIFNCAAYDVIRESRSKDKKFSIVAEKPTGRGGYSDLLIQREGQPFIEIEHENNPQKSKGGNLKHCIKNLSKSNAKYKLLISYYYDKYPKERLIREIRRLVSKARIKNPTFKLHLMYSNWFSFYNYKTITL